MTRPPRRPPRPPGPAVTRPRLLFVSYHCSEDPTNGAALATRDQFGLLSARGWDCRVLSGPMLV